MTDEPYADPAPAEPELRAALATLVDGEPPAPPVLDDVARGQALRRRRRTRAGAVVGLAAVLVAVVAAGALIRPGAPAVTPAQGSSPAADGATAMAERLRPTLATMGFTVTGAETVVATVSATRRPEIRLSLADTRDPRVTGELWVLGSNPDERLSVPYYVACTESTCPGVRQMTIADGITPTSGFEERGATSGSLDPPGGGARILDREYGTGSLVEVVSVPGEFAGATWTPRPGPSPDAASAPGLLSFEELSRLLTAVGDPLRPVPRPVPSTSMPVTTGLRGVAAASSACPDLPDREIEPRVAITGTVLRLWVCATSTNPADPANPERRGPPQLIALGDGDELDIFRRELAQPDGPPPVEGTACRAMLQLPRSVVVQTTDGFWLARLPRDSCRLFSAELDEALGRASR